MEMFVQKIKERTERCDDKLPSRRYNFDKKSIHLVKHMCILSTPWKGRLKFTQSISVMEDKSTVLCVNLYN